MILMHKCNIQFKWKRGNNQSSLLASQDMITNQSKACIQVFKKYYSALELLYTEAVQFSCILLPWPVWPDGLFLHDPLKRMFNSITVKSPRGRQGQRGDTNPNDNVSTCSPDAGRGMWRAQKGRERVTGFMLNCQRAGGWPVAQIGLFMCMGRVKHLGLHLCDWLNSLVKIQRVNAVKSCISCRFWNGESLGLCRDLFTRFDHYEARL